MNFLDFMVSNRQCANKLYRVQSQFTFFLCIYRFRILCLQPWGVNLFSLQHHSAAVARTMSRRKMGNFCLPHPVLHLHRAPSSHLCPVSLCHRGWSQQGQRILCHSSSSVHSSVSAGEAEESSTLCSCLVLALVLFITWPLLASQCSGSAAFLCHLPGSQLYPLHSSVAFYSKVLWHVMFYP